MSDKLARNHLLLASFTIALLFGTTIFLFGKNSSAPKHRVVQELLPKEPSRQEHLKDIARYERTTTLDALDKHPCQGIVLWKRCMYASCDAHPGLKERDDTRAWNPESFDTALESYLKLNTTRPFRIYLATSQVPAFYEQTWPRFLKTQTRFVLVMGASVKSSSSLGNVLRELLNSRYLIHAFATNCDVEHERLTPVGLGIDFHTDNHPVRNQSDELLSYAWHQINPLPRAFKVIANFNPKTNRTQREHVVPLLKQNLPDAIFQHIPNETPRQTIWNITSQVEFVISPPGHGVDCHRHWETLMLGAIPIIIRRPPLTTRLFDGMPVVQVDSYKEVTVDKLLDWQETYRPMMTAFLASKNERVFSSWWMREVLSIL
eukprot:m.32291 g.32291  ORF g.32291 m.32291 type:complete len:375 (+) comp12143_c0_seq1:164-1288(+)